MHELSIVTNILDTIEENAISHNATIVHEIELEVGELAGVEFDALEFAMEHAPKSELLKNVKFNILKVKPIAKCQICQFEFETSEYASDCPKCKSFKTEIIKGNELKIKSFKMD
ncbi:MAG: hydrogenase maturation nickel metallochaperone HypA [Bacteroidetes bacterium]|nr:hydrogenase maturation nickel metallochaperone HypA [Bacteroidota bacterium]